MPDPRWNVRQAAAILPAYNAGPALFEVTKATLRYADPVVVVDDGSSDGSCDGLEELPVQLLRHDRNMGVGRSIRDGLVRLRELGHSKTVTMDADGQHHPGDIPRLAAMLDEHDLVLGTRYVGGLDALPDTKVAAHLLSAGILDKVVQHPCVDVPCGHRAFRAEDWIVALEFDSYDFLFEHHIQAIARGQRIGYVPIAPSYDAQRLQGTRAEALIGLLRAALRVADTEGRAMPWLHDALVASEKKRDFQLIASGIQLSCFFVNRIAGYIVQGDPPSVRLALRAMADRQHRLYDC